MCPDLELVDLIIDDVVNLRVDASGHSLLGSELIEGYEGGSISITFRTMMGKAPAGFLQGCKSFLDMRRCNMLTRVNKGVLGLCQL